jgi:hypothetical protein
VISPLRSSLHPLSLGRTFLADRLQQAMKIAERQQAVIVQIAEVENEIRSDLLDRQKEIIAIALQSDFIAAKQQLNNMKTPVVETVVESVEETVKKELNRTVKLSVNDHRGVDSRL